MVQIATYAGLGRRADFAIKLGDVFLTICFKTEKIAKFRLGDVGLSSFFAETG